MPSGTEAEHMPGESGTREAETSVGRVQGLIIVARDQPDLWRYLAQQFAEHTEIRVLLDRRQWERRHRIRRCDPERRRADRRRPLSHDTDLRYRSFLIVPQWQGALESRTPDAG
jgi:hypothetical protein